MHHVILNNFIYKVCLCFHNRVNAQIFHNISGSYTCFHMGSAKKTGTAQMKGHGDQKEQNIHNVSAC